jgi:hypothetical protein
MLRLSVLLGLAACHNGPSPDVVLDPPPSGQGFQLATQSFDVPAGMEKQICYFFTVPGTGTDPIWIHRTTAALNPGSHHLNVFRVNTVKNLDGNNGDVIDGGECWTSSNWADWPLVINNQQSNPGENVVDWTLPTDVAHRFTPGEKLMVQIHYVNATTQQTPGHGKGIINFWNYTGSSPIELGTVFATNQNIKVCPGDVNKSFYTTCRFAKAGPVTVIGANGHFHSRGVEFQINAVDSMNTTMGDPFYTSTTWNDPPFMRDLNVTIPQMGGFGWTCDYSMSASDCGDPTKSCCATFGGHVDTQEHCNAFVYYYPKSQDAACF